MMTDSVMLTAGNESELVHRQEKIGCLIVDDKRTDQELRDAGLCFATIRRQKSKADILHVTPRPDWQRVTARARFAMNAAGRQETLAELPSPSADGLASEIRDRGPRLVFVHAFAVPTDRLAELAERWPAVQFVLVSHSQENHVYTWPHYFAEMASCLEASTRLPNLTMAGSDDSGHWQRLGYRFARWHWPCELQPWQEPLAVDPPLVLITSRADPVKALPAQILGAALLQRETGVRVAIAANNESDQRRAGLDALVRAAGLQAERWPWVDAAGWLRRLREQVSVVLQPSMSETFNYVSWEAGITGRPWVGSPAITHTPAEWQADPNSPADIARVGAAILSEYGHCSRWAWKIADHVGRANNRAYAESIGRLLGSGCNHQGQQHHPSDAHQDYPEAAN